jgi:hypothetical protein
MRDENGNFSLSHFYFCGTFSWLERVKYVAPVEEEVGKGFFDYYFRP